MTDPALAPPPLEPLQVRRAPSGYVAQRMPVDVNGHPWLLAQLDDEGRINLQLHTDDEVAEWPVLRAPAGAPAQGDLAAYVASVRAELDRFDGQLQGEVGFIVGAASSCWSDLAGAGVFESERASALVDLLVERVARCACNTTEQRTHVAGEQAFCSAHR